MKSKIYSEIFSFLKKHLARYTSEPKGMRGIQQPLATEFYHFLTHPPERGQKQTFDPLTLPHLVHAVIEIDCFFSPDDQRREERELKEQNVS